MRRINHRSTSQRAAVIASGLLVCSASCVNALAQGGLPYTIQSPEGSVSFGRLVASGSDVDGDGRPDIFVGDPGVKENGDWIGRWAMYSGVNGALIWSVAGTQAVNQVFEPEASVAFIDDMDGDDRDDVLLGLIDAQDRAGVLQVYSGRTGALIREFFGQPREGIGADVERVGDLNGDGVDDFAYTGNLFSNGLTYVRSGATGEVLLTIEPEGEWSTRRLAGAGDLDGDRVPDLILATFQGGDGRVLISRMSAVSGATGEEIWSPALDPRLVFGSGLVGGVDLTGDSVPDVVTRNSTPESILVLCGATGEVVAAFAAPLTNSLWGRTLAFADVNGDGRTDLTASHSTGGIVGLDVVHPITGRLLHSAVGNPRKGTNRFLADETAIADVNGDGVDDLIVGSAGGGVVVHGGARLLLNFAQRRSDYNIAPGQEYDFTVLGARPGRSIHLLGSLRGNGCTFVPRLGICIDLDQRISRLGSAVAERDRTARFTLEAPINLPRGPLWLQAVDPADPNRGAITSNVMRLEVVD